MFKNNLNRDREDYTCDTISHYEQAGLYCGTKEVLKTSMEEKELLTPCNINNKANIHRTEKVWQPALVNLEEASKTENKEIQPGA